MKPEYIFIDNIKLAYKDSKTAGKTILCFHGNSSSSEGFKKFSEAFSLHYRVIALDFLGHGLSERSQGVASYYSFNGFSQLIKKFIHALNIQPAYIIGHSLGGHAAIQALPELDPIEGLILISSPPISMKSSSCPFFLDTAPLDLIFKENLDVFDTDKLAKKFIGPDFSDTVLNQIIFDIKRTDGLFRHQLGQSLENAQLADEIEILEKNPVNLLLIGGRQDSFINPEYYEHIRNKLNLDNDHFFILENAGHYPHIEYSDKCIPFINHFLHTKN